MTWSVKGEGVYWHWQGNWQTWKWHAKVVNETLERWLLAHPLAGIERHRVGEEGGTLLHAMDGTTLVCTGNVGEPVLRLDVFGLTVFQVSCTTQMLNGVVHTATYHLHVPGRAPIPLRTDPPTRVWEVSGDTTRLLVGRRMWEDWV